MKKSMLVLAAVLMLFCLSGCSGSREWNRPAGVIVVSGEVDAGDVSRISAEKNEGIYTFPLDAAMVYYFDAGDEQSFAGEQNVSSLQYSANIDTHTISAAAEAGFAAMRCSSIICTMTMATCSSIRHRCCLSK